MLTPLLLLLPLLQDAGQDSAPPPPVEPLLSIHYAGLDALLVDPKDRALREALSMTDERLVEVLREAGQDEVPPGTVELLTGLLGGPVSLTLDFGDEPVPGLPVPLVAELLVSRDSADAARSVASEVVRWFERVGLSLPEPAPGERCALPAPVPMWMGLEAGDFFVRLGSESGVAPASHVGLLPTGVTPAFAGRVDYGAFLDLMLEMEGVGDTQADEMMAVFDQFGMTDMVYEWALATDAERTHLVLNLPGWGRTAGELGLIPTEPITPGFLRSVPADATWMAAFGFDLHGLLEYYQAMLDSLTGGQVDLVAEIERVADIDIEQELIAPFGQQAVVYASDTTGGGGAMSMVMVVELADRAALVKTLERAKDAVNDQLAPVARGYVRYADWSAPGGSFGMLTFPGVPVPFEPTIIVGREHAVLALTPQAALAAIGQIAKPGASVLDNRAFLEQLPGALEGCIGVQFIDTARLLRDGYGTMSLVCSALGNAVRSPLDPGRDPGMILPSFNELCRGAKATVGTVRLVGDDLRTEYRADRSHLVNATGLVGMVYNGPVLPLVALGMTGALAARGDVPMVGMASVPDPRYAEAYADIDAIHEALYNYAISNGDRYPDTLEELVIPDENGMRYLEDKDGIYDPWGEPYGYRPPTEDDPTPQVWCVSMDDM